MNFETVIGLEVHVELNTNSKIFSPTSAHFGNEQNANTNVIDWSFPGVLPVLNKGVVDAGIKTGSTPGKRPVDHIGIGILLIPKVSRGWVRKFLSLYSIRTWTSSPMTVSKFINCHLRK